MFINNCLDPKTCKNELLNLIYLKWDISGLPANLPPPIAYFNKQQIGTQIMPCKFHVGSFLYLSFPEKEKKRGKMKECKEKGVSGGYRGLKRTDLI